jgi:predicted branched-subunit amino acid permease
MRSLNRTAGGRRNRSVLARAIMVAAAVGAYGLSYGVLGVAAGLSPALTTLSSVIVLAGGSQFAFVGVLAAGGSPFAGAIGGLLLNVRFLAFSLAIAPHLGRTSLGRALLDSYLVVDEPVALALAEPDAVRRTFRLTGLAVVIAWISMTALGAYGGRLLGDLRTYGLDAAFPAGFLALLAPWLRTRAGRIAAGVGAGLALVLTPVAPPGVAILTASVGALVALVVCPSDAPPAVAPDAVRSPGRLRGSRRDGAAP